MDTQQETIAGYSGAGPASLATGSWHALGTSVTGANHQHRGEVNQDALLIWPETGGGLPLVAAVADGHGSPRCPRSHEGSRLAVQAAVAVLQRLALDPDRVGDPAQAQADLPAQLARLLVEQWRRLVSADLAQHPVGEAEQAALSQNGSAAPRQAGRDNPYLIYGSTVLGVLVTGSYLLCLQLGDGDILLVDAAGATNRPFGDPTQFIGDETPSLCSSSACEEVRVCILPLDEQRPVLALLSTDGYAKSFLSDSGFLAVGRDYLELLRTRGRQRVKEDLGRLLSETSQRGSGDDITLALIKRTEEDDIDLLYCRLADQEHASRQTATALAAIDAVLRSKVDQAELVAQANAQAQARQDLQQSLAGAARQLTRQQQDLQRLHAAVRELTARQQALGQRVQRLQLVTAGVLAVFVIGGLLCLVYGAGIGIPLTGW